MPEGSIETLITSIFKVPPRPEPPLGSAESLRIFNAAPGFYRYRLLQWGAKQLGTAFTLVAGLAVLTRVDMGLPPVAAGVLGPLELLAVALFVAQLPLTFLMVGLDYRYRWYMVTDTSLRIREGIASVHERTMTFANIQNLSLRQGPLQRLLGIADLRVRTAGGGEAQGPGEASGPESENMHLGYFRGVDNAAEIRDLILAHMRGLRDSGLGDPDEPAPAGPPPVGGPATEDDLLGAARALRDEASGLRAVLE